MPAQVSSMNVGRAHGRILREWHSGSQGWMSCPDDLETVKQVSDLARSKRKFRTCLVLGIGGSDLGTRAAWHALKNGGKGEFRLEFLGGNTDPDEIAWTLKGLDLKRTLINIISKSGDTLEPMTAFFVVREALIRAVGRNAFANQIVATTDEESGSLRRLANKEGYATLSVPPNVGGRFSVLTPVGLFPLACAGADLGALLAGARSVRDMFLSPGSNPIVEYTTAQHAAYKKGQRIQVLMLYSERLRVFGAWYRQLVAESLGKQGKGPTPIAALGATDQHSQLQLYMDGPKDKTVTFIEVERFASDLRVPASAKLVSNLSHLSGVRFDRIIHAERSATAQALKDAGRPNGTITIPDVSERSLGALFQFFMISTAMQGHLLGVNPYDQPGVESGKSLMRQFISG